MSDILKNPRMLNTFLKYYIVYISGIESKGTSLVEVYKYNLITPPYDTCT